jgi:hypothetical protein
MSGDASVRIVLVAPAYPSSPFSGHSLPVGIGYLAQRLEEAGIGYAFSDMGVEGEEACLACIGEHVPEYVGISMMTQDVDGHYRFLRAVRERFPRVRIVAGGPHVSFLKTRVMEDCDAIDFAIVHEGETALFELVSGRDPHRIGNMIYRDDSGRAVACEERPFVEHLDSLGFPRYEGFPLSAYGDTMQVVSSRGCPFSCTFCAAHLSMGKRWRARSAENILEEFAYWTERGYRKFNFVDSNFFMSQDRVIELCDVLKTLNLELSLTSDGMRAASGKEAMLRKAKEAGLERVAVGIESANDDILGRVRKGETMAEIESCMAVLRKLDISVLVFFILGLPGETWRHVMRSFAFALSDPNICAAYFSNPSPIPGTELHAWAVANDCIRGPETSVYRFAVGLQSGVRMQTPELPLGQRQVLWWISKILSRVVRLKWLVRHALRRTRRER